MAWYRWQQEERVDPETFDPEEDYTPKQLEAYATAFLRRDKEENPDVYQNAILFDTQLRNRYSREVYNKYGVPDEEITHDKSNDGQTMYNRTHPEGRKVNSQEQRSRHGASFYR